MNRRRRAAGSSFWRSRERPTCPGGKRYRRACSRWLRETVPARSRCCRASRPDRLAVRRQMDIKPIFYRGFRTPAKNGSQYTGGSPQYQADFTILLMSPLIPTRVCTHARSHSRHRVTRSSRATGVANHLHQFSVGGVFRYRNRRTAPASVLLPFMIWIPVYRVPRAIQQPSPH
jgi:hypothetical protein